MTIGALFQKIDFEFSGQRKQKDEIVDAIRLLYRESPTARTIFQELETSTGGVTIEFA